MSEPGFIVLRRLDGTVLERFSVLGATLEDIDKAVEKNRRATDNG